MRPVMRTIALFLLLVGVGIGQLAAQGNPPLQDNPQGGSWKRDASRTPG